MTHPSSVEDLTPWLRLTSTPGVGDESARKLLAAFGMPSVIFEQTPAALGNIVTPAQVAALAEPPQTLAAQCQAVQDWLTGAAADAPPRRVLTLADRDYPAALLEMPDPPLLLYVLGRLDVNTATPRALAIVGSRNPTPQGEINAQSFAKAFGNAGLCVVSGMALGIDGAAHVGALDAAAGTTIAVVGTGLDRVYPKRHLELAHRIAERGAMVSEFPLGTPPLAPNFPRRNRIICALSQGTLVVEAAVKSGSLITARLATEQGKDVFAIPGSIHSPQSRGCHWLIKQGAKLVESAQDVLEELALPDLFGKVSATKNVANNDDPTWTSEGFDSDSEQKGLLKALGYDPVSLDALQARLGMDTASLQAALMTLELDGQITRLPGGLFQRMVNA
jgi:DNA processing protein